MNTLKSRIAVGEMITLAWTDLGSPDVAAALVHHGWPLLVIDGEHGIGDLETWVAIERAIVAAGGEAILRVPSGDPALLKRVLDRGFKSIIVPMVSTVEEARAIVDTCYYPGHGGNRGFGAPLVRASNYHQRPNYMHEAQDELLLIVQCETGEAVDNIEAICALDGIGMVFIGPNDLAGSLGKLGDLQAPELLAAIKKVEAAAAQAGMPLGTITSAGRSYADLRDLGYKLTVSEADVLLLATAAAKAAKARDAELSGEGRAKTAFDY